MRTVFVFCILCLITSLCYSQEIKKIVQQRKNSGICEEFYVLKSDRSIKNGNYAKYLLKIEIQKYLQEFGNYENGKKNGSWFYFSTGHPLNPLTIIGQYSNEEKSGQWVYFYLPETKDSSSLYHLGFNRQNYLVSSKKELSLTLDTTGLKVVATGHFSHDKKVGLWRYYSRYGKLIKTYDFSTEREVFSLGNDSVNFSLLDGFAHFKEELGSVLSENLNELISLSPATATFEIKLNKDSIDLKSNDPSNNPFASHIGTAIKNIPQSWTDFYPVFENLCFTLNLKLYKINDHHNIDVSIDPKF